MILGAVVVFIFIVSFLLYHLPPQAVLYPLILSSIVCIMSCIFGFQRVKREHDILQRMERITDLVTEDFPEPERIIDEDYQKLICRFEQEYRDNCQEAECRYVDMMEYYTVWAHQIKTPIASMRLHLQNEDSALSRTLMSDLHRIEQYVEMVLTFLRLNSDSTDYVFKEYDLDTIVKTAVKKFKADFIGRKITLVYQPLHQRVVTDEKWLSFVIEQVLSNALKYTYTGSITISMVGEKILGIEDTGIGIAAEDLPRIFENGYTGYNGRMDHRASGIGLYLCRRICSNLGHTITADSIVDVGTKIEINLSQQKLEIE